MITGTFTNSNIILFDLGENHYSPEYIRNHPNDFDKYGNKRYIPDYDDD